MPSKKRKWMDSYVEFGFTREVNDGVERAQCMQRHTILGCASLKPSLLKTHQERSHPGLQETLPSLKMKKLVVINGELCKLWALCRCDVPFFMLLMRWHYSVRKQSPSHNGRKTGQTLCHQNF